jgi:hypothetical protein
MCTFTVVRLVTALLVDHEGEPVGRSQSRVGIALGVTAAFMAIVVASARPSAAVACTGCPISLREAVDEASASNSAIHDLVAREFLPLFDDAITSLNWLWEPEIDAEMSDQMQALVQGDTDPGSAGQAIEAVAQELRSSGRSSYYP